MTSFSAVLLGLIQGLTEFLPVSSSGHLALFQSLLNFSEPPVLYDVLLHGATLLAVVYYFRAQLLVLKFKTLWLVALATVPAVLAGLLLGPLFTFLMSSLLLLGLGFLFTGWLNLWADRLPSGQTSMTQINPRQAWFIGFFQAVAILPAISRSGATIYAGLKVGLTRKTAVAFAFIISIPAIIGANLYQLYVSASLPPLPWLPVTLGLVTAFFTAIFSLRLLEKLVLHGRLHYFAWYCFALGSLLLIGLFID